LFLKFTDDFRITACINVLKHVKEQHDEMTNEGDPEETNQDAEKENMVCVNPECTKSRPNTNQGNRCIHAASNGNVTAPIQASPRKGKFIFLYTHMYLKQYDKPEDIIFFKFVLLCVCPYLCPLYAHHPPKKKYFPATDI
jgi:hypothetical protein